MDTEFQFYEMKMFWRLSMLTLSNCTLKMVKMINFMLCILPHIYNTVYIYGNLTLLLTSKLCTLYVQ